MYLFKSISTLSPNGFVSIDRQPQRTSLPHDSSRQYFLQRKEKFYDEKIIILIAEKYLCFRHFSGEVLKLSDERIILDAKSNLAVQTVKFLIINIRPRGWTLKDYFLRSNRIFCFVPSNPEEMINSRVCIITSRLMLTNVEVLEILFWRVKVGSVIGFIIMLNTKLSVLALHRVIFDNIVRWASPSLRKSSHLTLRFTSQSLNLNEFTFRINLSGGWMGRGNMSSKQNT